MKAATKTPKLIPFHRLARRLPGRKEGSHLHPAALYRWHKAGLLGADGKRVRLEAQRVGGHWCTTWRKLRAFFARLSGEKAAEAPPIPATKKEIAQELARAEADLDRLGVGRAKPAARNTPPLAQTRAVGEAADALDAIGAARA